MAVRWPASEPTSARAAPARGGAAAEQAERREVAGIGPDGRRDHPVGLGRLRRLLEEEPAPVEPALDQLGAERPGHRHLALLLDALDEDERPRALGLRGDRADDVPEDLLVDLEQQVQVELDDVGGEHREHGQRPRGGADVVERHRAPERPHVGHVAEQRGRALGERAPR